MTIIDVMPSMETNHLVLLVFIGIIGITIEITIAAIFQADGKSIEAFIVFLVAMVFISLTASNVIRPIKVLAKIEEPTVELFEQWEIKTVNDDGTVILRRK